MINRLSKAKSNKATPQAGKPVTASRGTKRNKTAVTAQIEQLHADVWTVRLAAATELGKLGGSQATNALCAALRDSAAEVAFGAAVALGELRDASAVSSLAAVVLNADGFYDWTVRAAAADALSKLQDRRAFDALLACVRDRIAEVSQAAIRALGFLGDERAIDSLVAVVRNQNNYYLSTVRQTAVEALGRLAVPSAKESLRSLSADTYLDASVRQAADTVLATANGTN
jgi:HEAT repeat protein